MPKSAEEFIQLPSREHAPSYTNSSQIQLVQMPSNIKEAWPAKILSCKVGYHLAANQQDHLPNFRHVSNLPTRNVELGIFEG